MKKFLLLGLFIATIGTAQNPGPFIGESAGFSGYDNFAGTGALSNPPWTEVSASGYGVLGRVSDSLQVTSGTKGIVIYTGKVYSTTQQASIIIPTVPSGTTGPVVLMQPDGTGYVWITMIHSIYGVSAGGGVGAVTDQCPANLNPGDQLLLSATVVGGIPTLTCTDVTQTSSASAADTNICGGSPCSVTGNPGVFVSSGDSATNFGSN